MEFREAPLKTKDFALGAIAVILVPFEYIFCLLPTDKIIGITLVRCEMFKILSCSLTAILVVFFIIWVVRHGMSAESCYLLILGLATCLSIRYLRFERTFGSTDEFFCQLFQICCYFIIAKLCSGIYKRIQWSENLFAAPLWWGLKAINWYWFVEIIAFRILDFLRLPHITIAEEPSISYMERFLGASNSYFAFVIIIALLPLICCKQFKTYMFFRQIKDDKFNNTDIFIAIKPFTRVKYFLTLFLTRTKAHFLIVLPGGNFYGFKSNREKGENKKNAVFQKISTFPKNECKFKKLPMNEKFISLVSNNVGIQTISIFKNCEYYAKKWVLKAYDKSLEEVLIKPCKDK